MWQSFAKQHDLTEKQLGLFQKFYQLLLEQNRIASLTAIHELTSVIDDHFTDSLALGKAIDLTAPLTLADIGSGGGFPGIPLKIVYPQLKMFLIEVTEKKIAYLKMVIDELGLDNIEVIGLDWRTFLRKTDYKIDLFCARASLQPAELLRMFKPASPYKNGMLVYWASQHWVPEKNEESFINKEFFYTVANKERKLIIFRSP